MSRDELLLSARPSLSLNPENKKDLQTFQDSTLRPILKLQNDVLITYFNGHLKSLKKDFSSFTFGAKKEFIREVYRTDAGIRRNLRMMVVGMLTQQEMWFYLEHKRALNKRISELILKRICDQVELIG